MFPFSLLPIIFGATHASCSNAFFFFPTWYKYLSPNPAQDCEIKAANFPHDLLPIGLAILELLMRLAGFVAVIMIIISGVSYIMSAGNTEKAAAARTRLYNSLIGLAIALIASGFVAFIGGRLSN